MLAGRGRRPWSLASPALPPWERGRTSQAWVLHAPTGQPNPQVATDPPARSHRAKRRLQGIPALPRPTWRLLVPCSQPKAWPPGLLRAHGVTVSPCATWLPRVRSAFGGRPAYKAQPSPIRGPSSSAARYAPREVRPHTARTRPVTFAAAAPGSHPEADQQNGRTSHELVLPGETATK